MVNFSFSAINRLLIELGLLVAVSFQNMKHVEVQGGDNSPEIANDPTLTEALKQACDAIEAVQNLIENRLKNLKSRHIESAAKNLTRWPKQEPKRWHELNTRARALRDAVQIELSEYLYYQYPKAKGEKLRTWTEDWKAPVTAFPLIETEVFCAVDCYALGHDTASVFHSMRVAEHGLRALAKERRVKLPRNKPLEWGTWQDIIKALDSEIAVIGSKKAGAAKDAALEFYSGARADLNGFKDEYRNLVMHVRAFYDHHQSLRALEKVQAFMGRLAAKLHHKGKRIRWGLR